MPRVTLPPNQPPRTGALKRFDASIEGLNRYYWIFMAALQYTRSAMQDVKSVEDLIEPKMAQKLNLSNIEYLGESLLAEQTARYNVLVLAVTYYEEYLKDILTNFLSRQLKPDKTYRISFKLNELPSDNSGVQSFLESRLVDATVADVLKENYRTRWNQISNLLKKYGAKEPALPEDQKDLAELACEVRNCIVHCGGVIDKRTYEVLSKKTQNAKEGDQLKLEEKLLWELLGSLRDSVLVIDSALRANNGMSSRARSNNK